MAATLAAAALTPPPMSPIASTGPGSYSAVMHGAAVRRRVAAIAASAVLAGVIGLMAIYVGTSSDDPGSGPAPAAALEVSSTPVPADAVRGGKKAAKKAASKSASKAAKDTPKQRDTEPGQASTPEVDDAPTPVTASLVADAEADARSAAASQADDPAAESTTKARSQEPVREPVTTSAAIGNTSGPEAASQRAPVVRTGWICDGEMQLQDPRGRNWALDRATFRAGQGYERVVLHLDLLGPGAGAPSAVTAEGFASVNIRKFVRGARQPSAGRSTFSLLLDAGIGGSLELRGYRPSGVETITEFSVYPAGQGSRQVLVSAAAGQCFRMRVPAWADPSASSTEALIYFDVKS